MSNPFACPKCGHVRKPGEPGPLSQCTQCGIVFAKYAPSARRPSPSSIAPDQDRGRDDSRRFTLPTWLTVAVAIPIASLGVWLGYAGTASWDGSYGYERSPSVVLIALSAASFLVAGLVLLLARSRLVRWIVWIVLILVYAALQRPEVETPGQGGISGSSSQR